MTSFQLITPRFINHQEGGAVPLCDCLDINILIRHFHKNSSDNRLPLVVVIIYSCLLSVVQPSQNIR